MRRQLEHIEDVVGAVCSAAEGVDGDEGGELSFLVVADQKVMLPTTSIRYLNRY